MSFFDFAWQWLTTASHWSGSNGVPARLIEHVEYTVLAMVIAIQWGLTVTLACGAAAYLLALLAMPMLSPKV